MYKVYRGKTMIPQEELNRFMLDLNKAIKETGPHAEAQNKYPLDAILSLLNSYLFLARETGMAVPDYEIIRKALQDITNWLTIGVDIETFSVSETATPASKDHVLLEL